MSQVICDRRIVAKAKGKVSKLAVRREIKGVNLEVAELKMLRRNKAIRGTALVTVLEKRLERQG